MRQLSSQAPPLAPLSTARPKAHPPRQLALLGLFLLGLAGPATAQTSLIASDFSSDPTPFSYLDDAFFGTAQPAYAQGSYRPGDGFAGGGVRVEVGGVDGAKIKDMSGAWQAAFQLPSDDTVRITLRYRMQFPPVWTPPDVYEANECSQVLVAIDGVPAAPGPDPYLAEFCGASGGPQDTGWQLVSLDVPLTAGLHSLSFGAYSTQKTTDDELTYVDFDDVELLALGLVPGAETTCDDGLDNDDDGDVDCADLDCAAAPLCEPGGETTCDDGVDNDADGPIDCADPSCDGLGGCELGSEQSCGDLFDNDADGQTDCADLDCAAAPVCELGGELTCDDGVDNDADGQADCADPECSEAPGCDALLSADFAASATPFAYADDVFGTSQPAYADGQYEPLAGFADGALRVEVGGVDRGRVRDMSGAWQAAFQLASDDTVRLSLRYRMQFPAVWAPPDVYEADECSQVRVEIDGLPVGPGAFLSEFCGATGGPQDTGWQLVSFDVPLPAGPHTLSLGAFGNQKTTEDEITFVDFDEVELLALGLAPGAETTCDDGLDNDADGDIDCADLDCAVAPLCEPGGETTCDDGVDNDADGLADCLDPSCDGLAACELGAELSCSDAFDNDADAAIDCFDADCAAAAVCELGGELTCNDGLDNDADGDVDCGDTDCADAPGCDALLRADFDSTPGPFAYADDLFLGTSEPAYADGGYEAADGFSGGGLRVSVGGVDRRNILGISGGWQASFQLASADTVRLSFRYRMRFPELWAPPDVYESDECSQVLAAVDGLLVSPGSDAYLLQSCGASGGPQDSGWQLVSLDLPLEAGTHTLSLGAYNNKKTFADELTRVDFDDVEILALGLGPGAEISCDDGLDIDGDGRADCADPDCGVSPICEPGGELSCGDGLDNDGDGLADCLDPSCDGLAGCELGSEATCDDGVDNDADGLPDCGDPDCLGAALCEPGSELSCDDGFDNDGDGATDCADADCEGGPACQFVFDDFEIGSGSFVYQDDAFRHTANPAYATGSHEGAGGFGGGGGLRVRVGGVDDQDVVGMSGGWLRSFDVEGDRMLRLTLRYRPLFPVTGGSNVFESDECLQVLAALDGVLVAPGPFDSLEELCGGDTVSPGWRQLSFDVPVTGGSHVLAIGAHVNAKTTQDEVAEVFFDDVEIRFLGLAPLAESLCSDGLDNDADASIDCADSDCSGAALCELALELVCFDDFDNDGDAAADCADPDCAGLAGCEAGVESRCGDDFDNDADGLTDCADPDCDGIDGCTGRIDADFSGGADGFSYADDLFRGTSNPGYASGGAAAGSLRVELGGVDDAAVAGISGGWSRSFTLPSDDLVSISLRYRVVTPLASSPADAFEPGDCLEVLLALDGNPVSDGRFDTLDRICGGIEPPDSGWRSVEVEVPVGAGTHDLDLGAWLSGKSDALAAAEVFFDDVRLTSHGASVLLFDDFSSAGGPWTVVDQGGASSWRVSAGHYLQDASNVDKRGAFYRGTFAFRSDGLALTDYRVRLKASPLVEVDSSGRDALGVMIRYLDNSNYYRFLLSRTIGVAKLEKRVSGSFSDLAFDTRGFDPKQPVEIEIEAAGSRIRVWVDGELRFSVDDPDLGTGSLALYAQNRAQFDHVVALAPRSAPAAGLSSPVQRSVAVLESEGPPYSLPVVASDHNLQAGDSVRILLDGGTTAAERAELSAPPFETTFADVAPGEHRLDLLVGTASGEARGDANPGILVAGKVMVALGDSITAGQGDGRKEDDETADGVQLGRGYAPILAQRIREATGDRVVIYNEGIGGETVASLQNRLEQTLDRYPSDAIWLVVVGTNAGGLSSGLGCSDADLEADAAGCGATYKDRLRDLVLDIQARGATVVLGKVPFAVGVSESRNARNREFNEVIDELVTSLGLVAAPDFYSHFEANPDQMADSLHPNGTGYRGMTELWLQALLGLL